MPDKREAIWQQLVKEIEALHEWLRRSGLRPSQIEVPKRKFNKNNIMTMCDIKSTLVWVTKILKSRCDEIKRIYGLCPPDTWIMYAAQGFEGMREQKLLAAAGDAVRREWRRRPNTLKKSKRYGKPRQKTEKQKAAEAEETRHHRRPVKGRK